MRSKLYTLLGLLLVVAMLLPACAPATPQVIEVEKEVVVEKAVVQTVVVEKEVAVEKKVVETVVVETEKKVVETVVVEKEVEKVVTATPEPAAGGGTLVIASTSDIDNYDPHWNQLIAYAVLIRPQIFNTLAKLSPDMTVVPDLAESWDISDDGTVYTFHLRPSAKFHNGRAVTADDVYYSLMRTTEQKTTFATKLDPVESMRVIDDVTLEIITKTPWAPFIEDLGLIAIIPEEAEASLSKEPIGSGPFKFVEWVPNDHITLAKNPDYDVPGEPKLDEIIIKILPDFNVALTNLEAGEVDAVYDVPVASAERFVGNSAIVFQSPPSTNSLRLIELSVDKYEPLQDVRVRTALAMCLDKEVINDLVYFGAGEPQWSPLPKSSWAYIEPLGPSYDPEAAKALLAEAGYPDGFDLDIEIISGSAVMENVATIWQAGLEEAGVKLNINSQELSSWLDKYINRKYQTIMNGMNVRGDPHTMFDIIYKPHLLDDYPNQEMLDLLTQGAATVDMGNRKAIYAKLQQLLVDEMAPVLIVQSQPILALTNTTVQGWVMNAKGDIFFESIYMAE
jgi:peptide/nickel transport system substrate-binding protein